MLNGTVLAVAMGANGSTAAFARIAEADLDAIATTTATYLFCECARFELLITNLLCNCDLYHVTF